MGDTPGLQRLSVGIAQMAPVWLDRELTLAKVARYVDMAADKGCRLLIFGEALVPGYPFWIENTNGAKFNAPMQKQLHAHYMQNALQIQSGHLDPLCRKAAGYEMAIVLGCIERAEDRGGHSIYASLIFIAANGEIRSVHRKLMPTYEERLSWAPGDGHGLKVHPVGPFRVGCLNCWENWMPLARAALYGQGENLHVALWPGGVHNTYDVTRFIAMEGRCYVISASGLMRKADIPANTPYYDKLVACCPDVMANGGSCIAGPDGAWITEPVIGKEEIIIAELEYEAVLRERHNFDPAGHYARPDVLMLKVNRQRQSSIEIVE